MSFREKVSAMNVKRMSRKVQIMRTIIPVLASALFLVMLALPVAAQTTPSGGSMKLPAFRKQNYQWADRPADGKTQCSAGQFSHDCENGF